VFRREAVRSLFQFKRELLLSRKRLGLVGFLEQMGKNQPRRCNVRVLKEGHFPALATDFRVADLYASGRDFNGQTFRAGVGANEREELVYAEEADAFFEHEGFATGFGFVRVEDDLSVLRGQPEDGIVRFFCGVTAEHAQQAGQVFLLDDEFHLLPTMSLRALQSRLERIFRGHRSRCAG